MNALVIAIGNPLHGDDGVAHAVVQQLGPGHATRAVLQLTPEIAAEVAAYDPVIFIDADARAQKICVEPVSARDSVPVFTHVASPVQIVALARALYGFTGRAFVCRIPAADFSPRQGLSSQASEVARSAALTLQNLLL